MMIAALAVAMATLPSSVKVVSVPPMGGTNDFVIGSRKPLAAEPFRKLPLGTVKPLGWLKRQLQLEADGFIGHLTEISPFLEKKNNAWLSPTGAGEHGWEEVPYWLKGFGDLGVLLDDSRINAESKVWIEGVLASQRPDGWFGPEANRTANHGKPDMWPNMVMLNVLQSYYEHSADPRVLAFMGRYFQWQLAQPEDSFYLSYWEKHRGGDNLASVYWLYDRTGDAKLLDLAHKIHRRTADWVGGIPDYHGVNFAQAFREPAEYASLTGDPSQIRATEADYETMRAEYGLVPGGMYGADENARPGFTDPRQAAETCAMVEMMYSCEMLLRQTGDIRWAERCEDVAFNSLPASMTDDLKALHYLTSPNMPLADARSKAPGLQNGGPMLLFDPHDHRCCQHNVSHGWPYFTEHLWFATDGNGLAAPMYAPSRVSALVGDGTPVTITEETRYPFGEVVSFSISLPKATRFPLTLRLPSWCGDARIALNGKRLDFKSARSAYAIVDREWHDGDRLDLKLPMRVSTVLWAKNKHAVSVQRGPLTYSLKIGQQKVRSGGTDAWPAFALLPSTPWNYGLDMNQSNFRVEKRAFPADDQPFSTENAPVEIHAMGRKIGAWQLDQNGLVMPLQLSPARTSSPVESLTLIPMGAARLRISSFPTVSPSKQANGWREPQKPKPSWPASASHIFGADTVAALSDALVPHDSNDQTIPRFTWWDHKGGEEWVQYDLPEPMTASKVGVYWFDDRDTGGGCRVPSSWKLLYKNDSGEWKEIEPRGTYTMDRNSYNSLAFKPVRSRNFRIVAELRDGYSGGILEWVLK